jgi:hypothetical protein
MASRKQSKKAKQDPLLDNLDEIDEELDQMEKEGGNRNRQGMDRNKASLIKTIALVLAAALAGAVIHVLIFPPDEEEIDRGETISETYSEPEEQEQEELSNEQAKKIINGFRREQIVVDGDTYSLDMKLQDFVNHGWQYASNDGSDHLDPGRSLQVTLIRNGRKIESVYLENTGEVTIPLSEASVQSLYLQGSGIDARFPLGIEIGMSSSETQQCLQDAGIPYKIENTDWNTHYTSNIYYSTSDSDNYEYGSLSVYVSVDKEGDKADYYSFSLYGSDSEYISISISQ